MIEYTKNCISVPLEKSILCKASFHTKSSTFYNFVVNFFKFIFYIFDKKKKNSDNAQKNRNDDFVLTKNYASVIHL